MDIWDVRRSSSSTSSVPNLLRTLRTPAESGPVSCIVPFPDGRHVATYVLAPSLPTHQPLRDDEDEADWQCVPR